MIGVDGLFYIFNRLIAVELRAGGFAYVIERFMNVYQAVFPLFIWSFQEKSVILRRN